MKSPKGKPSKLQENQIRFLRNLDCDVEIISTVEQIDKFLEKIQSRC